MYLDPQRDDQPVRLVGWAAADVAAGEAASVSVVCDARMWRPWDTDDRVLAGADGGVLLVARGWATSVIGCGCDPARPETAD